MKSNTIRLVVLFAAVSVLGILIVQLFWVRKAFDIEDNRFNMTVNIALRDVARQLYDINDTPLPLINPVAQLTQNYFVVSINGHINPNTLEPLLKGELEKRGVQSDFEYGIYDCQSEKMVYGNYIHLEKGYMATNAPQRILPKWENQPYYFGVMFPNKNSTLVGQMGIWIFSSLVLLLVIAFFVFAMWVILQQKRLSEVQKDFINNMTHEFKTPISTISISAGVLKQPNIIENPKRLANYANIIHNEATRLKEQVERVLQMATIDEDTLKMRAEQVNIHEIIATTVENMDALLNSCEGQITTNFEAEHYIIKGDMLHLTNILFNILDNAIKYCEEAPNISIKTINTPHKIIITITDNGIGIAKDHIRKVFDKFYRVPTGNIHDVKGFGLGLNYVKVVVNAHKGSVKLESKIDVGSTVTITLPL
jgi:two-component system, OmpR family, phosphate regulon sensor histidine kinase PhoR